MTTFEPGASDDFTHGLRVRPRSTAFFASRPAAIITDGFDVFVHDVIAAMTTEPCSSASVAVDRRPAASSRATVVPAPVASATPSNVGGSLAGNESAISLSYVPFS